MAPQIQVPFRPQPMFTTRSRGLGTFSIGRAVPKLLRTPVKREPAKGLAGILWCERGDLNPHELAPTRS
jgi:hypothetical protein